MDKKNIDLFLIVFMCSLFVSLAYLIMLTTNTLYDVWMFYF